jgi:DNA-binding protein HU-beta
MRCFVKRFKGKRVNKTQLVDAVAEVVSLPKATVASIVDATFDCIKNALTEQQQVVIAGHGTYIAKKRAARNGRDPRTGNPLQIPETIVASFKPGKGLKEAVNAVAVGV